MAAIIFMGTGAYFVFSGLLLIALLRSAARTSDDWIAYTLSSTVQLTDARPDSDRAHDYVVAGDVSL